MPDTGKDKDLEQWRREVEEERGQRIRLVTDKTTGKPTRDELRYQNLAGAVEMVSGERGVGGIAWPWGAFQEELGPLIPGRLYVVGSRPSNGKTSLLLAVLDALHAAGVSTVYFGTEMEPEVLLTKWALGRLGFGERFLARQAWDELSANQRRQLEDEIERLAGGSVLFPRCLRLDQTELDVWTQWAFTELDAAGTPKVIILDHLHQLRPAEREDPNRAVHRAILALKDGAVERRAAVIVASQLRRPERPTVFDLYVPPSLSQFKGASAIEECADLALGLWRPLKPGMTRREEREIARGDYQISDYVLPNSMKVICLKSRFLGDINGRTFLLEMDGGRLRETDHDRLPLNAGDAYEDNGRVPF